MSLQLGECFFPCSPLADAAGLRVRSLLSERCQEQRGSLPWLSVSMAMALRHPFSTATSTYAKSGLVLGSQGGNKCKQVILTAVCWVAGAVPLGWPSRQVHDAELPVHIQHSYEGGMDKPRCSRGSAVPSGGAAKSPPASPTFTPQHGG